VAHSTERLFDRCFQFELGFRNVGFFVKGGKLRNPGWNPRSRGGNQEQTQPWFETRATDIGGRRALSPLLHPCDFCRLKFIFIYHQIHHRTPHPQENVVQAMIMMEDCKLPMPQPLLITPMISLPLMIMETTHGGMMTILTFGEMTMWMTRTILTQNSLPVRKYPFCWQNKTKVFSHL